jgi:hypothetical protein
MMLEEELRRLEAAPLERLRWRVLEHFGVLPGSRQARSLRDRECVRCGLHMVLDRRERAHSGGEINPAFDMETFARRKEASGG